MRGKPGNMDLPGANLLACFKCGLGWSGAKYCLATESVLRCGCESKPELAVSPLVMPLGSITNLAVSAPFRGHFESDSRMYSWFTGLMVAEGVWSSAGDAELVFLHSQKFFPSLIHEIKHCTLAFDRAAPTT